MFLIQYNKAIYLRLLFAKLDQIIYKNFVVQKTLTNKKVPQFAKHISDCYMALIFSRTDQMYTSSQELFSAL